MKEVIHILTTITRPKNLFTIAGTLANASRHFNFEINWHWIFDHDTDKRFGAHILKNEMLSRISDGWIWVLDDDTIVHKDFFKEFVATLMIFPDCQAFVVSQERGDDSILRAAPENLSIGHIDFNQVIFRRSLMGDMLIPEHYCGDGELFEKLLTGRTDIVYSNKVLSAHNALRR